MATPWNEVENSPDYQGLDDTGKQELKTRYWENVITQDPEFQSLSPEEQTDLNSRFMGTPQQPEEPEAPKPTELQKQLTEDFNNPVMSIGLGALKSLARTPGTRQLIDFALKKQGLEDGVLGMEQTLSGVVQPNRLNQAISGASDLGATVLNPVNRMAMRSGSAAMAPVAKKLGGAVMPQVAGFAGAMGGLGAAKEVARLPDQDNRPLLDKAVSIPATAAKDAALAVPFGASMAAGANLMFRQLPLAERVGSAAGAATFSALSDIVSGNKKDALYNAVFNAGMGAAMPMRRNPDITIAQQEAMKNQIAQRAVRQLGILSKSKGVRSTGDVANRVQSLSSSLKDIYDNKDLFEYKDAEGNIYKRGLPENPIEAVDALSQLESRKWDEMEQLQHTEAKVYDPINGKWVMKKISYFLDPDMIKSEIANIRKNPEIANLLRKNPSVAEGIIDRLDILEKNYPSMSSKQVNFWLKDANFKLKRIYNSDAKAANDLKAEAIVADAIRTAHEKLLDNASTKAGKAWREKRMEVGRIIQMKTALQKQANRYQDVIDDPNMSDNIMGALGWIKSGAKLAMGNFKGVGADILKRSMVRENQTFSDKLNKAFEDMRAAEAARTLNQRISEKAGQIDYQVRAANAKLGNKGELRLPEGWSVKKVGPKWEARDPSGYLIGRASTQEGLLKAYGKDSAKQETPSNPR